MKARTLVLDQSYIPIRVVGWQRAICLVFTHKAEILENHLGQNIHSVSQTFPVPSIIRLRRNAIRRLQVKLSRENIYRRDNWKCAYCNCEAGIEKLTIDHILPLSKGGPRTWENLVTACRECNFKKGGRTPEQAHMRLHVKPHIPRWSPKYAIKMSLEDPPVWQDYLHGFELASR